MTSDSYEAEHLVLKFIICDIFLEYILDAVGSSQIFLPTQNLERAY